MLKVSLILGAIAALADVAGGLVLVRARGVERGGDEGAAADVAAGR